MRPLDGPLAVVRTDPAPCFLALENDSVLHEHRIALEIGRVKNRNKNPVAEKAVQAKNLNLNFFDKIRMAAQFLLFYCLSPRQP